LHEWEGVLENARRKHHFLTYLHAEKLHALRDYFLKDYSPEENNTLLNILTFINPKFSMKMLEAAAVELENEEESSDEEGDSNTSSDGDGEDVEEDEDLFESLCFLGEILDKISFFLPLFSSLFSLILCKYLVICPLFQG
jgi:hypothetical protein